MFFIKRDKIGHSSKKKWIGFLGFFSFLKSLDIVNLFTITIVLSIQYFGGESFIFLPLLLVIFTCSLIVKAIKDAIGSDPGAVISLAPTNPTSSETRMTMCDFPPAYDTVRLNHPDEDSPPYYTTVCNISGLDRT